MINANDPAAPCPSDLHGKSYPGLTILQEFAARSMQGIRAGKVKDRTPEGGEDPKLWPPEKVAALAVADARALINELNKDQ